MSHLSLYRKYRPQALSEVIGQDHITQTLKNAIRLNKISHAYLFAGPRGTGKTSVAKILAKSLNCKDGPTEEPCGDCDGCKEIASGTFVDVLEIDAASNRGIDEIRDLKEKIHFAPAKGKTKVYIIDEVHMLTTEAFNALLKTLEEPPSHVVFVLATTEPHRVLSTILSRCQRFDFKRITLSDLLGRLKEVAKSESIKIDSEAMTLIAKHAQGSLRDALGALDQLASFTDKKIKTEDVVTLLGMSDAASLIEAARIIGGGQIGEIFGFLDELTGGGKDPRQFTKDLIGHFRAVFAIKNAAKAKESLNLTEDIFEAVEGQTALFSNEALLRLLDILSEAAVQMRWEADGRLFLELALVKAMRVQDDRSELGLISRIEALEKRTNSEATLSKAVEKSHSQKAKEEEGQVQTSALIEPKEKREEPKARASSELKLEKGAAEPPKAKEVSEKGRASAGAKEAVVDRRSASNASEGLDREGEFDQGRLKRVWPLVLGEVAKESLPTHVLLLECAPVSLAGGRLTLNFNWRAGFHKDMVERDKNLAILSDAFHRVSGSKVKVECTIDQGPPEAPAAKEEASHEPLDGDHIIDMLMNDLGAEIEEG